MPVITAEMRMNGARKSAEVRRSQKQELIKLRALVAAFHEANPPKPPPEQSEIYTADRLTRVRKQLDRLDELVLTEKDPQKLDRLVSASSRLEEQERRLSGRFAPGQLRPTSKPTSKRYALPEPSLPDTTGSVPEK